MKIIELEVNATRRRIEAEDERSLLSVMRDDLDLTGAKYGCGEGQCGACTVLVDGQPARACVTRVGALPGKRITTIEGLERDGRLHPLQDPRVRVHIEDGRQFLQATGRRFDLITGEPPPPRTPAGST